MDPRTPIALPKIRTRARPFALPRTPIGIALRRLANPIHTSPSGLATLIHTSPSALATQPRDYAVKPKMHDLLKVCMYVYLFGCVHVPPGM